ncbi:hypothetical protein GGS24DRAFT_98766 [Hypoxylon argillaceum]|nr:hypothetical protein GGS24DRAFT_98766 [Hypoxylon argillaceum]
MKPTFLLVVCDSPFVFGPLLHHLESLASPSKRIRTIMSGAAKHALLITSDHLFVHVRHFSLGHALAVARPETGGKRFFLVVGKFFNEEIAEIIGGNFPHLRDSLPSGDALLPWNYPTGGSYGFDNSGSRRELGMTYRSLRGCIVDAVRRLEHFDF